MVSATTKMHEDWSILLQLGNEEDMYVNSLFQGHLSRIRNSLTEQFQKSVNYGGKKKQLSSKKK